MFVYVSVTNVQHGTNRMYQYERCRCAVCRRWNADRSAQARAQRSERRELVDGRWTATYLPWELHRRHSTYVNHRCRCRPCTDANTEYGRTHQ